MISKNKAEIDFGGEKRTFYFGLGFLNMLVDETEYEMKDLQSKTSTQPLTMIPLLMYYSLKFSCLIEDKEIDFNKYKVISWFDDDGGLSGNGCMDFMSGFGASTNSGLPEKKGSKKKV
tara:strand:+ start:919 stop:1272 length:354 start_codon:yes stop_codon:yes gene_type:complete